MKNTIVILLISQICVITNAQKYVLLNDLKYIGEIAYFNHIKFTGNSIQKTSYRELIKSELYYQGKKMDSPGQ